MGGNYEESAGEDDLPPFPDPNEGGHSSQKYAVWPSLSSIKTAHHEAVWAD